MSARDEKREQFQQVEKKKSKLLLPTVVVLIIALAGTAWLAVGGTTMGGPQTVKADADGTVLLPAAAFEDGKAKYYRYQGQKGAIDFFVVKSTDGTIRAAFDSCDVCYHAKKGYRQEGDKMICNNCDMAFRTDQINLVKGGCNPAPLDRRVEKGKVAIDVAALERGSGYFNF